MLVILLIVGGLRQIGRTALLLLARPGPPGLAWRAAASPAAHPGRCL
jgi:hypothetical protein